MRPWLHAMLVGGLKPDHLGICDRCAAEFHGRCLKAQISYLRYGKCKCHRRGCKVRIFKLGHEPYLLWKTHEPGRQRYSEGGGYYVVLDYSKP